MSAESDRMTDLTRKREALLKEIGDRFGYDFALLLFIDQGDHDLCLLCAYAHARDRSLLRAFQNKICCIESEPDAEIADSSLEKRAAELIEETDLAASLPGAQLSYHVLTIDCAPFDDCQPSGAKKIGVLVTAGMSGTRLPAAELKHVATEISIGRFERFISTVLRTQNEVSATQGSLDDTIRNASHVFAKELGAASFLYRNKNKESDWSEHWVRAEGNGSLPTAPPEQPLVAASESTEPDLAITRRPNNGETLEVTLTQRSYRIVNLPFGRADALAGSLTDVRSQAIGISFRHRHDTGYLQNRFSETDQRIAGAVYNNLQNFAELKLADESYEQVFSILHGKSLSLDGSANDFLQTLRRLSMLINNVYILSIGRFENEIEIRCEAGDKRRPINASYIERLNKKYLDRYYHGKDLPDYDRLAMGMDANDRHFYLEAHMPREFNDSRVYVISFSEPYVAQPTLNSLTNLFTELFTRMKEEDFRVARSSVLTETRHAVFHHFAAAINWIMTIKVDWSLGLRFQEHWARLREDPVFPEGLDWANWSLQQAHLILENGRFLAKEIDQKALNRKPMNVSHILQDCYRALQIEARRKSVQVAISERGKPPVVATGDEVLMRIAIMNLLDNAIKYSLNRGSVSCEIIYRSDRYEVRISNRGDPIPQKIFKHLLQIGARGKQRDHLNLRPGTGLGLPVTYKILRAHSDMAALKLDSTENSAALGGASNTFFFEMPYLTGLSNVTPPSDDRRS